MGCDLKKKANTKRKNKMENIGIQKREWKIYTVDFQYKTMKKVTTGK